MLSVSNRSGFTLIELMISVAIIGILATITFGNFIGQADKNSVKQAANQLATDLERQFTNAQSGVQISGVTPSGYGVYITTATPTLYHLYSDWSASGVAGYGYYDGSAAEQSSAQSRLFPANTKIDKLQQNIGGVWTDIATASFQYMIPGAAFTVHDFSGTLFTTQIQIRIKHITKPYTACLSVTPSVGAVNIITCQ